MITTKWLGCHPPPDGSPGLPRGAPGWTIRVIHVFHLSPFEAPVRSSCASFLVFFGVFRYEQHSAPKAAIFGSKRGERELASFVDSIPEVEDAPGHQMHNAQMQN